MDAWTGQPLSDATVSLLFRGRDTRASVNGVATLPMPALGDKLLVTHVGYLPILLAYAGESEITARLWPRRLSGRVLDATTQRPLANAWVHLDDQLVRTNAEGQFTVGVLRAAGHLLVRAAGYTRGRWVLGEPALASRPAWDAVHPLPAEMTGARLRAIMCDQPPCVEISLTPFPVRALYIPLALLNRPDRIQRLLDMAQKSPALNGVVIDVKGDTGKLAWDSHDPTAIAVRAYQPGRQWLPLTDFLKMCRQRGLYVIARMVVFKDAQLAAGRPELAIQRPDGSLWTDRKGTPWVNPFLSEVWDYQITLAREVAALGVDEIQLDYVRFPSDGNLADIRYGQGSTLETRTMAIRQFVERFVEDVRPLGVFVAADVFGLTVWVVPESDMLIGQRVMDIAPLVDYLNPMVYPSTFIPGNLGLDVPKDHPYEVVQRSVAQAATRVPAHTRIRPWLQAYGYSLAEMQIQRHAAKDGGASGWMFWNAAARYARELFGPLPDLDALRASIAERRAAEATPPAPPGG